MQRSGIRQPAGHSPVSEVWSVIRAVSTKMREGRLVSVICFLCLGLRITEAVPVEVESQSE